MSIPDLSPGAGWHRVPGYSMPGSTSDLQARAERAYPCWVLTLRRNGRRLPAESLLHEDPVQGAVLMIENLSGGWDAHFYQRGDFVQHVLFLHAAELVRDRNGCRLYQGLARDAGGVPLMRQSWLCTPCPDRTRDVLAQMAEREWR